VPLLPYQRLFKGFTRRQGATCHDADAENDKEGQCVPDAREEPANATYAVHDSRSARAALAATTTRTAHTASARHAHIWWRCSRRQTKDIGDTRASKAAARFCGRAEARALALDQSCRDLVHLQIRCPVPIPFEGGLLGPCRRLSKRHAREPAPALLGRRRGPEIPVQPIDSLTGDVRKLLMRLSADAGVGAVDAALDANQRDWHVHPTERGFHGNRLLIWHRVVRVAMEQEHRRGRRRHMRDGRRSAVDTLVLRTRGWQAVQARDNGRCADGAAPSATSGRWARHAERRFFEGARNGLHGTNDWGGPLFRGTSFFG
jgi:hypothetical protein